MSSVSLPFTPGGGAPLKVLDPSEYGLAAPEQIPTPRLLIYHQKVGENIGRMRSYLERASPGSQFRHLRCHAKTCKSSWAIREQLAAGITRFKATPNELELLLRAGVRDIVLAYPPLPRTAEMVARAIAVDGETAGGVERRASGRQPLRLLAQVGAPEHAAALVHAARGHGISIDFLLDLDVGMGRTGAPASKALGLLDELRRTGSCGPGGPLRFAGLHAYDGHNHSPDPATRDRLAREAMGTVVATVRALEASGLPVARVVVAGTPAFLPDLVALLEARLSAEVEVSPGTWLYWDSTYEKVLPGLFTPAVLLLASVMDRTAEDRVTLDLGHKRWAIDSGPLDLFGREGLEFLSASEEHTVLRVSGDARSLRIGDRVLLAPRHVCPTVNLWGSFDVIGPRGEVEIADCPVDGRNP